MSTEVPPEHAEKIAAKMIAEQRLLGFIDQKSGVIHFEGHSEELQQWDRHIRRERDQNRLRST